MAGRRPEDARPLGCGECPLRPPAASRQVQFCPLIHRVAAAGAMLARAGDPIESVWVVRRGAVGAGPPGSLEAVYLPGATIGLEAPAGGCYPRDLRALDETELCAAPRDAFARWRRWAEENPG